MTKPKVNSQIRPKFLRWAGSKQPILKKLLQYVPPYKRYVEPFCGSCALFFATSPKSAILSDTNHLLIRTLRAVRKTPVEVYSRLIKLNWSEAAYYKLRPTAFLVEDDVTLAANFIFLNANCFNGIFRLNRQEIFNVPYSGARAGKCPSEASLLAASKQLAHAKLVCADFETTVRRNVRPGDFVYLDPPFAIRNRRIFFQYRYDDFGLKDIKRLRKLIAYIDDVGAHFLLTYASSDEADGLARGWSKTTTSRIGNIAGFRSRRSTFQETIITNARAE